jgi:cell division protein FtsB
MVRKDKQRIEFERNLSKLINDFVATATMIRCAYSGEYFKIIKDTVHKLNQAISPLPIPKITKSKKIEDLEIPLEWKKVYKNGK